MDLRKLMRHPPAVERIAAEDLAFNMALEQQRAMWHALLKARYGLHDGDQFDVQSGVIRRAGEERVNGH